MNSIKGISIIAFTLILINVNAQFTINGSGLTETRMWAHGNYQSNFWAINYSYAYSFGIDNLGIGNVYGGLGSTNRLLSFSDSWINNYNFKYSSFGNNRHNRFHQSKTGSFGGAFAFNFNPNALHGLIIENVYSESSGMYFDGDYVVLWSPGNYNRLLRIYDEDGMIEKAFIDGEGYYYKNSDMRRKENITKLNGINALEGIREIRGVEYNHIQDLKNHGVPELFEEKINGHIVETTKIEEKDKNHNTKKYYGFIAQEVEKIFPDIITADEYGNKFMDYTEIIPILVEAIKELDNELEKIKNNKKLEENTLKDINDNILNEDAILYQNSPNPFTESTEIKYYLPEKYNSASIYIYIYDMQGSQINKIPVYHFGNSSIKINGSELNAGMYYYTLIADSKVIDTKKMILTD